MVLDRAGAATARLNLPRTRIWKRSVGWRRRAILGDFTARREIQNAEGEIFMGRMPISPTLLAVCLVGFAPDALAEAAVRRIIGGIEQRAQPVRRSMWRSLSLPHPGKSNAGRSMCVSQSGSRRRLCARPVRPDLLWKRMWKGGALNNGIANRHRGPVAIGRQAQQV